MRNETRERLGREYLRGVARFNFTEDVTKTFSVEPTNQQRMFTSIQASTGMLKDINIIPVTEQSGEKVQLGVGGSIAGRTDTQLGGREPRDPIVLGSLIYDCKQTNFDTALSYGKLDMWAVFPDFTTRIRNALLERKGLDMIMIGLNGTHAAADTDRDTYPLLQDVNVGWLHHIRTQMPERVVQEVVADSGKVTVGKDGDYKNIDGLIWDAYSLIPDELKESQDRYVVIASRYLLSGRNAKFFTSAGDTPSEIEAAELVASSKQVVGLKVLTPPFMPRKSILITPLSNLSIYYQEGKDRRRIVDNSKRDQVENYESSNIAYVVEDFEKTVLVDNVSLLDVSDWESDEAYAFTPGS